MIHSFLLIGQSNMSGRGFLHEVAPIENKDILVLQNGRWQPMFVPVNPDRMTAGINLAESFADLYARDHGVQAGLTSNADLLHFNAASLREFGVRYYREFSKLEDQNRVFSTRDEPAVRTELEHL